LKLPGTVLFVLAAVALHAGCLQKDRYPLKKARSEIVTRQFDKGGLAFSFPDNWRITRDAMIEDDTRHINVEDGEGTIFMLQIMTSGVGTDLNVTADNVVEEFRSFLPKGRMTDVKTGTAGRSFSGKLQVGVRKTYIAAAQGVKVPFTIDIYTINGVKTRALVVIQSLDDNLAAAEKEIQVIADTLRLE
jgi:hypothetical protein